MFLLTGECNPYKIKQVRLFTAGTITRTLATLFIPHFLLFCCTVSSCKRPFQQDDVSKNNYRNIPKISPSKYKRPKPVTQKALR